MSQPDMQNDGRGGAGLRTSRNHLLGTLLPGDLAALEPHFVLHKLAVHEVIFEPNTLIEYVYFPEGGLVSLTSNGSEGMTEIGVVGREGLAGVPVLLGSDRSPHRLFAQMAGPMRRIATDDLMQVMRERPAVRERLMLYVHTLMVQTAQTVMVNARYSLETRLARWLLMCHDRADGDELEITHEFMSMMLGVRRAGVTVAVQALEGNKLIQAKRGRIRIVNRAGLEEVADDSYGLPEAEYARLLGAL